MIIFVDSEGGPIQELSAIAMSPSKNTIVNIYHNFGFCSSDTDVWARKHIHGLDPEILIDIAFPNESLLIKDFKTWLSQFHVINAYGNNTFRESCKLNLSITDIGLPLWSERVKHNYHKIPNQYKLYNEPFNFLACDSERHRLYVRPNVSLCRTLCQKAKALHGWHCSLADVFELYLFYCENWS